jgi:hypothetical protein
MKGTPKKSKADIDISDAMKSANSLTETTARKRGTRPEDEKTMFVNLRLKETEHRKIGHLAIEAGITKAEFCKQSAFYIMEMVEAGAFSINGGNVIDRRKI